MWRDDDDDDDDDDDTSQRELTAKDRVRACARKRDKNTGGSVQTQGANCEASELVV